MTSVSGDNADAVDVFCKVFRPRLEIGYVQIRIYRANRAVVKREFNMGALWERYSILVSTDTKNQLKKLTYLYHGLSHIFLMWVFRMPKFMSVTTDTIDTVTKMWLTVAVL